MTALQLRVPTNVAQAVRQRWPERGEDWPQQVEDELHEICRHHAASPTRVLPARYGFVVTATTPSERRLVIRGTADPMGAHEAAVAVVLADVGAAPKVHEVSTTPAATWTVMDQVLPGTALARLDMTELPIDAMAAALRPMVGQPAPSSDLPRLSDWLHNRLEDEHLQDVAPTIPPPTPQARRDALRLLNDLAGDADRDSLCHGDTSWGNILLGTGDRLYLIDPRGMRGDVAYDAAVLALKSSAYEPPSRGARSLVRHLDLDREVVEAWLSVAVAARV